MDPDRATTSGTRSERSDWLTVGRTVRAAPDWTAGNAEAPSYLDVTGSEIVFVLIGVITVGAALLCVTSRNVVRAALWLVVALGGLAGLYLVLTAELVAIVQLLIYVGAVVVLLLFGLMVTAAPIGRQAGLDTANRPIAVVVAVAAFGLLVAAVVDAFRFAYVDLGIQDQGTAETIGAALFSSWVLPFEVLSVLLLAALIGAIAITRRDVGSQGHR